MIAALLLSLACTPALGWPTPVLAWDHAPDAFSATLGYRVYVRDVDPPDSPWVLVADLPVWEEYDADNYVIARHRYGDEVDPGGLLWPAQRGTDAEATFLEWAVSAYNGAGESAKSSSIFFCMPNLWQPGEVYE